MQGLLIALPAWNLLYVGTFYGWLSLTDHWTWLHSVLILATFLGMTGLLMQAPGYRVGRPFRNGL